MSNHQTCWRLPRRFLKDLYRVCGTYHETLRSVSTISSHPPSHDSATLCYLSVCCLDVMQTKHIVATYPVQLESTAFFRLEIRCPLSLFRFSSPSIVLFSPLSSLFYSSISVTPKSRNLVLLSYYIYIIMISVSHIAPISFG